MIPGLWDSNRNFSPCQDALEVRTSFTTPGNFSPETPIISRINPCKFQSWFPLYSLFPLNDTRFLTMVCVCVCSPTTHTYTPQTQHFSGCSYICHLLSFIALTLSCPLLSLFLFQRYSQDHQWTLWREMFALPT